MKKDSNSWVKVLFGGLGTIMVAWVGQYLYDIINIQTRFDNIFVSLRYLFNDFPYSNAVRSFDITVFERYGYIIASGLFGGSVTILAKAIKHKTKDTFLNLSCLLIAIASVLIYLYSAPVSIIYGTVYRGKNNIEIIKPYISNQEYDILISRFYQIESKKDYKNLIDDVKEVADDNNLILQ